MTTPDPEPAGQGFKPLRAACTEPVVRLSLVPDPAHPDAGDIVDMARAFVVANREFSSPTVHYAEAVHDGTRVMLARCPDPDTANRLARKLRDHHRSLRSSPLCGYASSGWTSATRSIDLP